MTMITDTQASLIAKFGMAIFITCTGTVVVTIKYTHGFLLYFKLLTQYNRKE